MAAIKVYDAGKVVAFQRITGSVSNLPTTADTIGTLTFLSDSAKSNRTYLYLQTTSDTSANINISALFADEAGQLSNTLYFGGEAPADYTINASTTTASFNGDASVKLTCLPTVLGGTGNTSPYVSGKLVYTKADESNVYLADAVTDSTSINVSVDQNGLWTINPSTENKLNLGTTSLPLNNIYANTVIAENLNGTADKATLIAPTLNFGVTAPTDTRTLTAQTTSTVTFGGTPTGGNALNTSLYISCIPVIYGGTGNSTNYTVDRLMYSTYVNGTSGPTKIAHSGLKISGDDTNGWNIAPISNEKGTLGISATNRWKTIYAAEVVADDFTGTALQVGHKFIVKQGSDSVQQQYDGHEEITIDFKNVVLSFEFSSQNATNGTITKTSDYITADTKLINYFIYSGAQYITGPLSWEVNGTNKSFSLTIPVQTGTGTPTVTGIAFIGRTTTI